MPSTHIFDFTFAKLTIHLNFFYRFLFAFIFPEFASPYFFSLSRNLSGLSSLSCFRLSFSRLNLSIYVWSIWVWQVAQLPNLLMLSFGLPQVVQVSPLSMFLYYTKSSTLQPTPNCLNIPKQPQQTISRHKSPYCLNAPGQCQNQPPEHGPTRALVMTSQHDPNDSNTYIYTPRSCLTLVFEGKYHLFS